MGFDVVFFVISFVKLIIIFLVMVSLVPLLVWLERRGSAFIQNRFGPNRVGPFGLLQLLADAVKFLFKEEFVPQKGHKILFYAAPVVGLIPAALAFAAIPFSTPIEFGSCKIIMQGYDIGVGIIFVFAISSLAVYAVIMAGWGSGSTYSLYGALRASAQMISYELALTLSVVGIIMIYGTFDFNLIIHQQQGPFEFSFLGKQYVLSILPNWGIFFQPIGALLFFAATFAESNRLPFDLAESESELVAGFHTEYGGFKMLMFFIGEYGHMIVASSLLVTLYFGGFGLPFISVDTVQAFFVGLWGAGFLSSLLTSLLFFFSFSIKVGFFLWVFIWVRWTLPRFRYDHLMELGWKSMLPWALFNTLLTAIVMAFVM